MAHTFEILPQGFALDGQPFRFLAGAIHYFRVPRAYWRDRLLKLRACGFNTVETYVSWNLHERKPGCFDFAGDLDIAEFLRTAQQLGLHAIVRPGPYICSEWDFGGLPWWLLKDRNMRLRCMDAAYLKAVEGFFTRLASEILPLMVTRGGPVLMMQVENEYGSYGDDREYLAYLRDMWRALGADIPLFTSDGPTDFMFTGGTLPGAHITANFGSRPEEAFGKLREVQPEGPMMCMEYWNGWFDHWTEKHHTRSAEEAAQVLDEMLGMGASVCAYMFHGGTNFGFMNGANCAGETYQPTVNSYDDDAPLDESGDPTPKYWKMREVAAKHFALPQLPIPDPAPKADYGEVRLTESARLFDNLDALSQAVKLTAPVPMEQLDQGYGFILYRGQVRGPREEMPLKLQQLRDRALIYLDGAYQGALYRNDAESDDVRFAIPAQGAQVDVLVENMGRVNYGYNLRDEKGVTEGIRLGQQFLYHWTAYPLPLDDLSGLTYKSYDGSFPGEPVFLRGHFEIEGEPHDTFVSLPGFVKGVIFVNGRNLSRHWNVGPQRTAYLPAPWLRKGKNEIVVLELNGHEQPLARLTAEEDIGERA